ncbi:hypothetical protein CPB85DRAFT_1549167 [Mucidula mucida]|nr:hypothetical protein CPB85DRAFT_1549167 [Mucidula mucida]
MMDSVAALYAHVLTPIAPFSWFGLPVSTLDLAGAVRLCIIMRQIKDILHKEHMSKPGAVAEARSFARSAATTLTVVFGGEVMTSPLIGVPPSFMVSGTATILFTAIQALVDVVPSIPAPFFEMELPLSIVDGFTRAFLLCNLIPPVISNSAWALLITSFLAANGGFFLPILFTFMHPTTLSIQTPPELMPYGWTTADLWCAPLITGLYALLTHAQPVWAEAHTLLVGGQTADKMADPVDPESARALCAVLLAALFAGRTVKNFSHVLRPQMKVKIQ